MARKIKFALEMRDGEQVRDIEALREYFDLGKTVGYFQNGKLLTWLRDRYYDEEAEAVEALSKDDADFKRKLCAALGAKYEETEEIDTEEIVRRNERIALLKQHTADEAILRQIDRVAFNQEELGNLLDEGAETIYLCHGSFTIPCREKNKKYIGVGLVEVVIPSKIRLDFTKLGIEFQNVKFDSKYQAMCHHEESTKRQSQMLQQGKKAASTGNYTEAAKLFKEVAEAGNVEAMLELGLMCFEGKGGAVDYSEGSKWFKLVKETYETEKDEAGANKATGKGKYDWQEIVEQSKQALEGKLFALARLGFEQAAQAGNVEAMLELGAMYLEGKGVEKDYKECAKWFKQVKETMGKAVGTKACTSNSSAQEDSKKQVEEKVSEKNGADESSEIVEQGKLALKEGKYDIAREAFERAAKLGNAEAMMSLGDAYYYGRGVPTDYDQAIMWYNKAKKARKDATNSSLQDNSKRQVNRQARETNRFAESNEMVNQGKLALKEGKYDIARLAFKRAADLWNADAMKELGDIYYYGRGVARDYRQADEWYEKAEKARKGYY